MDTLVQDLRYAIRSLRKSPGYTSVAALALALGIGVNTAVFSVVNGVLLRPLRYTAADRLYGIWETSERGDYRLASYPTFRDWRQQSDVFAGLTYVRGTASLLRGREGTAQVGGAFVSEGFFDVLEGHPLLGRTFARDEERPGGSRVAVLTHALWQEQFGGDRAALGSTITLDDAPYTVVGILPSWFRFPDWAEVYLPLAAKLPTDRGLAQRGLHADSRVIARFKADVTLEQARTAMAGIQARLAAAYPEENAGWTQVQFAPLAFEVLGFGAVRPVLLLLSAAVVLVLLLACANVANMSLVRLATRSRELAIRAALGAGRGRVVRLVLSEAVVLGLLGAGAGLIGAWWGLGLLRAAASEGLPRLDEIALDGQSLGFAALLSLITAVLVGLAPAVRTTAPALAASLKEGSPGSSTSPVQSRLRSTLVALEVALALVLLIGAGLLIRSFWALSQIDPGFNPSRLITLHVFPPSPRYDAPDRAVALYGRLAEAIAPLPEVEGVALTNHAPLTGAYLPRPIEIPGRTRDPRVDETVLFRTISAEYFRLLEIPVRRGRPFTDAEVAAAAPVALVNETLAHRYWPGVNPVGRFVTLFKSAQARPDFGQRFAAQIVGVVGDVRHTGLENEPAPEVYIPYTVNPWGHMVLMVRTRGDPETMVPVLRRTVTSIDRDIPVAGGARPGGFRTMRQVFSGQLARRRFTVTLLGGFATGALLLAALGIYGVISYVVALRTHEIGIRTALGATPRAIVRLVLAQSGRVVAVGLTAGLAAAFGLTRLLASLLYGVGATDVATFAGVTLFFAMVAVAASYLPARRATKVDPMVALRSE
ncbi:MAG: ABC transporter permease [Gemmatimonadales bacterium]